jgi:CRP-like cAMP-binding protein
VALKLTAGDLQIVKRVAIFRGLRHETVEHIVSTATVVTLKTHQSLVRQEESATAFFIVIDGWVKLYRITESGNEAVIRILTKGDSFAESAALSGTRFLVSAEATGGARIVRIPADHVVRCIRESSDTALAMIVSLSQHMQYLVHEVEQLKAKSGTQRLAEFLLSLSAVDHGPCDIALPYDKVLIAARVGLTPASLSRAFSKLKPLGVLVHASHIAISDIDHLKKLISGDPRRVRAT